MASKLNKLAGIIVCLIILLPNISNSADNELVNILKRFKNYRFGTISVYELKNISELKKAIDTKQEKKAASGDIAKVLNEANPQVKSIIEQGVQDGSSINQIAQNILNKGLKPPEEADFNKIYQYYVDQLGGTGKEEIQKAYIITPRPKGNTLPTQVYALLVTTKTSEYLQKNLKTVQGSDIYSFERLDTFKLDETYSAPTLYKLMINALEQENVTNKTLEAQGIGDVIFLPKKYGISKSLARREDDITSEDIQSYKRVSDGEPNDIFLKENQLIVSPEQISWRHYKLSYYDDGSGTLTPSPDPVNQSLPAYGVELNYGIDDINYYSLWSERVTLSALWESVKLGIILPTNAWASITKDVFDVERKLTYGGTGIAGCFDFPVKVIPKSGVFHLSFGYVFGDAHTADYKDRNLDTYVPTDDNRDYMVRANGQLNYTFGIKVDESYLLRFSLGATVYNIEKWNYKSEYDASTGGNKLVFAKADDETRGGVSGKIEFMSKNVATPYGGGIQYFDQTIGAGLWLQIPMIQNVFAVQLSAKGYVASLRDKKLPWENDSMFIPMIRLLFNF